MRQDWEDDDDKHFVKFVGIIKAVRNGDVSWVKDLLLVDPARVNVCDG